MAETGCAECAAPAPDYEWDEAGTRLCPLHAAATVVGYQCMICPRVAKTAEEVLGSWYFDNAGQLCPDCRGDS
jgi:hypothetical protein